MLTLPFNTADPAVCVLSGTIPVEATIHKRATIEHRLAVRQRSVKSFTSHRWFIAVKEIFIKYNLPDPFDLLREPSTKFHLARIVNKHVNSHWESSIKENAVLYNTQGAEVTGQL